MGPWYLASFVVTLFKAGVLAFFMAKVPSLEFYQLAFLVWLGFMLPKIAEDMIFGGAPNGYVWHKIAITGGGSLLAVLVGAWVITLF